MLFLGAVVCSVVTLVSVTQVKDVSPLGNDIASLDWITIVYVESTLRVA